MDPWSWLIAQVSSFKKHRWNLRRELWSHEFNGEIDHIMEPDRIWRHLDS